MIATNVFFPLIILPTRITVISPAVIDHILTNDHKSLIDSGIIKTNLNNHYSIICLIDTCTFSRKMYQTMLNRKLKNSNLQSAFENLYQSFQNFF